MGSRIHLNTIYTCSQRYNVTIPPALPLPMPQHWYMQFSLLGANPTFSWFERQPPYIYSKIRFSVQTRYLIFWTPNRYIFLENHIPKIAWNGFCNKSHSATPKYMVTRPIWKYEIFAEPQTAYLFYKILPQTAYFISLLGANPVIFFGISYT